MAMMPPSMGQSTMAPPPPGAINAPVEVEKVAPKSVVDTTHVDMVHDAQLDFYGRRLATCSSDRTIKIFQIDRNGSHRHEATLEGHDGPVWQVAWAHPTRHGSALLASASHDGRVIVWMEESTGMWRRYYEYCWHASSVNSVAFAPAEYGLIFACASSDGFVSICTRLTDGTWDERRVSESMGGQTHTHPLGATSVSWAPAVGAGGLWMAERAAPPAMRVVSGGCDQVVKVWRYETDANNWVLEGKALKGHRDMVRSVAWAPNVGLPREVVASAGQDRKVIIWSREVEGDGMGEWSSVELETFPSAVWSVSWSPTGSVLGVAYGDDQVTLWKEEMDGKWKKVSDVSSKGGSAAERS